MELSRYLCSDSICVGATPEDKWDLLETMTQAVVNCSSCRGLDCQDILEAIIKREKQQSTGLGGGFAIPHTRIQGLSQPAVSLAVLKTPIDFDSLDKQPVNVVCLVVTPQKDPTIALKVQSQVSKLFTEAQSKARLMDAQSPDEILSYIKSLNLTLDIPITANEIMQKPSFVITPQTPLKITTALMSKFETNATGVVDQTGKLVGEITCETLFHYGIPDFFTQLKSISFINEFDPFEKYFSEEINSVAQDIMKKDFVSFPANATLLEIVFELTVKRHPKVYITDNGKLIGEISQISVLDRIINF